MRNRRKLTTALIAFSIAAGLFGVAQAHDPNTAEPASAASIAALGVQEFPVLESPHIDRVPQSAYNSNPPTSGPHQPRPLDLGVYDAPVPDAAAVHNLEHGGIWITYRPELGSSDVAKLGDLAAHYPNAVIMSPRPSNDSMIAVVSWGRMMRLDSADTGRIDSYIQSFVNQSPEDFSSLAHNRPKAPASPVIGAPFPAFELVDVDGNTINNETVSGKPTILWFTTSWCVPCQIGARRVAAVDDELAGDAFDVVVVFVDPRESDDDLRLWKRRFANPDWVVAFDNAAAPLAQMAMVQYLDTKFLIDASGLLVDTDVQIAKGAYLRKIRSVVQGG
jgi:thiol-disulfide isomerase/thioredoxin